MGQGLDPEMILEDQIHSPLPGSSITSAVPFEDSLQLLPKLRSQGHPDFGAAQDQFTAAVCAIDSTHHAKELLNGPKMPEQLIQLIQAVKTLLRIFLSSAHGYRSSGRQSVRTGSP
jgi:hypothetical protein